MPLPTHDEIRKTIDDSGCDVFAFFRGDADTDPRPEDLCVLHSISRQDTELLAVDIRRDDAAAVSGLITKLLNNWESKPIRAGGTCLTKGNLMLSVVAPPKKLLDEIMDSTIHAAVDFRGNKDFSVLILVPARRLRDEEVPQINPEKA